jgi:steroid 5-alpha reductase family enzyme
MSQPLSCVANIGEADPFGRQVVITFGCAFVQWVASVVIGLSAGTPSDPSLVDRLWSILPCVYVWHFYLSSSGPGSTRLLLMAGLSSVWGYVALLYSLV